MSVVLITNHDENIYDLAQKPKRISKKTSRFSSNFRKKLREDFKSEPKTIGTMGVIKEIPDPKQYLKKQTGHLAYTSVIPDRTVVKTVKKDLVPSTKECLEKYKRPQATSRNFVKKNVRFVKNLKVTEPVPKVVLDRFGESRPLSMGLEPTFIKSDNFGKVPKYLLSFGKIREQENQFVKDSENVDHHKCRYITKDERDKLLNGLKANWEELQKEFQLLPMLTDTIPKINRKLKLEGNLKQLESDIALIERHPYIYVYKDRNFSGQKDV